MHPGIPGLEEHHRRSWHDPSPLLGVEKHGNTENARGEESVDGDEMPHAREANDVPIARSDSFLKRLALGMANAG
jgi:hypothetical protein